MFSSTQFFFIALAFLIAGFMAPKPETFYLCLAAAFFCTFAGFYFLKRPKQ